MRNITLIILLFTFIAHSTTYFPFPLNETYPHGVQPQETSAQNVQSKYELWEDNYYVESGEYARIAFDEEEYTVSEGIGYGMLIMVYMDNSTNDTRPKFDKLWNYYKNWRNSNGVMHWKIQGFNSVAQENGATDAEIDVALALIMAYKQWGDETYLNDAKALIGIMWDTEVDHGNNVLNPGDQWSDPKNPSYFSTAALQLFDEVDQEHDWSSIVTGCYSLIEASADANTGLVPNWCDNSGNPQDHNDHGTDFWYDAVRTPWRVAIAYSWFGHEKARAINDKIAVWAKQETGDNPADIKAGYSLDGTALVDYENAVFKGALTCAGMVNADHQEWVDNGYTMTTSGAARTYYNMTLKVLYLLYQTGNMPNLWNIDAEPPAFTVSAEAGSGGSVSLDPVKEEYEQGDEVTITASPDNGFLFTGWSGISAADNPLVIEVDQDYEITAEFSDESGEYSLDITTTAGGSVEISPVREKYIPGESISITAVPEQGYYFGGFSGDLTTNETSASIGMDRNYEISAEFTSQETSGSELVTNWDFSNGTEGWDDLGVHEGEASGSVTDGEYFIDIASGGSSDWSIQLTQAGISLEQGKNYRFSFDAYSSSSSSQITARIGNQSTYEGYVEDTVDLTESPVTYSLDFEMTAPTDNDARIEFNAGFASGTVSIDNVSVKEVSKDGGTDGYVLYISYGSGGGVDITPSKPVYESGETVVLTALPEAGFEFDSWDGDASGTEDEIEIVMDSDKSIAGVFNSTSVSWIKGNSNTSLKPGIVPVSGLNNTFRVALPSSGADAGKMYIYTLSGRMIREYRFDRPGYHTLNLSSVSIGSGVYIVRLETGERCFSERIMINR